MNSKNTLNNDIKNNKVDHFNSVSLNLSKKNLTNNDNNLIVND